jgi:hypothetical protein
MRKVLIIGQVVFVILLSVCDILYSPALGYTSPDWINKPYSIRMDDIWRDEGIEAMGMNYYYLPKAVKGNSYSERFNPQSKYYQAWFGIYIIEMINDMDIEKIITVNPQYVLNIAIADQNAWLRSMGYPETAATGVITDTQNITNRWKMTGWMKTNADTGENNSTSEMPRFFHPPNIVWKESITSYGPINLDLVFYIYQNSKERKIIIIYYNGVEYVDNDGVTHITLPQIREEMENMVSGVKI